jgi:hypothetical protein
MMKEETEYRKSGCSSQAVDAISIGPSGLIRRIATVCGQQVTRNQPNKVAGLNDRLRCEDNQQRVRKAEVVQHRKCHRDEEQQYEKDEQRWESNPKTGGHSQHSQCNRGVRHRNVPTGAPARTFASVIDTKAAVANAVSVPGW